MRAVVGERSPDSPVGMAQTLNLPGNRQLEGLLKKSKKSVLTMDQDFLKKLKSTLRLENGA